MDKFFDLKKFQEDVCSKCKNKRSIDFCEIRRSSVDGHIFCRGLEFKNVELR